tara:strand:- start:221 stop:703 length:483 start_codon:yes stop_codon:yes gene_type:complete
MVKPGFNVAKESTDYNPRKLEKRNLIVMFLLSIFSKTLYGIFWFGREVNTFNTFKLKNKSNKTLFYIYALSLSFSVIFDFLTESSDAKLGYWVMFFLFVVITSISQIVLSFQFRTSLLEYCSKNKIKNIQMNRFFTFIFSFFYIQWTINKVLEISKNEAQ